MNQEETCELKREETCETPPGLAPRVAVSILVFFGLLIFSLIYTAFYASSFRFYQKVAIIAVALLVAIAILGAMWASWGIKYGRDWKQKGCK